MHCTILVEFLIRASYLTKSWNLTMVLASLVCSSGDEEPLVDAWINRGWVKVLMKRNRRKLVRGNTVW
jgi:hypothetical protein